MEADRQQFFDSAHEEQELLHRQISRRTSSVAFTEQAKLEDISILTEVLGWNVKFDSHDTNRVSLQFSNDVNVGFVMIDKEQQEEGDEETKLIQDIQLVTGKRTLDEVGATQFLLRCQNPSRLFDNVNSYASMKVVSINNPHVGCVY